MTDGAAQSWHGDWRTVEWGGLVRFRVPSPWVPAMETREGMEVLVFHPAEAAGGRLNVLVDARTPASGQNAEAVLHEMTLRFVRPDDGRASDRTVEVRPDGVRLAQAVLRTSEEGQAETHYLWLLGRARSDQATVAMFSFSLPSSLDGRDPHVRTLGMLDAAIRDADLL